MVIRIDARQLTDSAKLHAALNQAFGFPDTYGRNLDALIDCLTHLDHPKAALSRVQVLPGQVALLVLDHLEAKGKHERQVKALLDAVAFVNWRRFEGGEPPVLAVAYARE